MGKDFETLIAHAPHARMMPFTADKCIVCVYVFEIKSPRGRERSTYHPKLDRRGRCGAMFGIIPFANSFVNLTFSDHSKPIRNICAHEKYLAKLTDPISAPLENVFTQRSMRKKQIYSVFLENVSNTSRLYSVAIVAATRRCIRPMLALMQSKYPQM